MKKVYFAIGYQPVENFIAKQMDGKIEVVGSAVYRESILPTVLEKEPDILITRETLPGTTDFLEIIDRIRVECKKDVQIIFITGGRQPGDAFLSALVRYQVFDLVVGDNINMKEVCRMIEHPNKYRDVFMYVPKVTVDEKTKKEIFEAPVAPRVIEKEVIKEVIIDKTTVDDAESSKISLEELKKIEEQKHHIEQEQAKLLKMKELIEQERKSIEESKLKMDEDYQRRKSEFEEEMKLRLKSIKDDRDKLIVEEKERLRVQMEKEKAEIERLKEEASKTLNAELKQLNELKKQELEQKIKSLEEENERRIRELKDQANHRSMEEEEKYNQIKLEEIEKFQQDKLKLEEKYLKLKEEQERQVKLRQEQESQMKHQMELLKQEQEKLRLQKEHDLKALELAKKQLEEDRLKLQKDSETKIKSERENLERMLREQESKLNDEKRRILEDYNSLNTNIVSKLETEKAKIQKDANEQFENYKKNLKLAMLKKIEEERKNILSSTENDKSKLEQQFKEQQDKLQNQYKKELEDKMNALKVETEEKFKIEQQKIESFRKEEELRLKSKQEELEKEKERFELEKQNEIKNIELEKKRYEKEYKELEDNIKMELKLKEEELARDRQLMEEKQIQLKEEMSTFLEEEKERLKAINQEVLDKEKENLRLLEERKQLELEKEKEKLIEERVIIENKLKEQSLRMEEERKVFEAKMLQDKKELELIKREQEHLLREKELEITEKMNSQKEKLMSIKEEEEAKIEEKIRLMKEEEIRIAEREKLLQQQENANKNMQNVSGEKKVLTFIGCKSGVGTSTIAFNTAISLANKKKKVLFLELNHEFASIGYIYKLNYYNLGIDIALKQIHSNDYEKLSDNIISITDVIDNLDKTDLMQYNYKKMPKTLDYMFYSGRYYAEDRAILESEFKEFVVYLLTKHDYDYIVFDLNIKNIAYKEDSYELDEISQTVLKFSSKIYFVLTQDISAVGGCIDYRKIFIKAKMPIKEFDFILNRYESKAMLNKKGLEEWLQIKLDLVVPEKHKECINSNYVGLPLILNVKDRELNKSFNNIVQDILNSKGKKNKRGVMSFVKE